MVLTIEGVSEERLEQLKRKLQDYISRAPNYAYTAPELYEMQLFQARFTFLRRVLENGTVDVEAVKEEYKSMIGADYFVDYAFDTSAKIVNSYIQSGGEGLFLHNQPAPVLQ